MKLKIDRISVFYAIGVICFASTFLGVLSIWIFALVAMPPARSSPEMLIAVFISLFCLPLTLITAMCTWAMWCQLYDYLKQ